MKFKKSYLFLLVGAMVFTGCGKDPSGLYSGNETANVTGIAAQSQSASLNITSGKSTTMAGTYADAAGSGSFSGTLSDDGATIQNVTVTVAQSTSSATINGVPSTGCAGTYNGNLTLNNNNITGNLVISAASAGAQVVNPYPSGTYGSTSPYSGASTTMTACATATRSLNLTKQ